jgi:hypothetical protein
MSDSSVSWLRMATVRAALWLVGIAGAFVLACCLCWQEERLRLGTVITFGSLALAVGFLVVAGSVRSKPKRGWPWTVWASFVSCLGVCVGVATLAGAYLFGWPQWLIVCIAAPLGLVLFVGVCLLAG